MVIMKNQLKNKAGGKIKSSHLYGAKGNMGNKL